MIGNIIKALIIAILFTLPSLAQEGPCTVTRIVDGDTFRCEAGGNEIIVRLIGIDTPELPTHEGIAAKSYTESRIPIGTVVRLELDVQTLDYFRRVLAYVYLPSGEMLNEILLREGIATLMTIPPNIKHVDDFKARVKK